MLAESGRGLVTAAMTKWPLAVADHMHDIAPDGRRAVDANDDAWRRAGARLTAPATVRITV